MSEGFKDCRVQYAFLSHTNPNDIPTHSSDKGHLILLSQLHLGPPSVLFPSRLSTEIVCEFLTSQDTYKYQFATNSRHIFIIPRQNN